METAHPSSRLFVAVAVPVDVRHRLEETRLELRAHLDAEGVSWTQPEKFHLTVRFLGKVASDRIPMLTTALAEVAEVIAPFDLVAGGLGCFPNLRHPRVVWAGIHDTTGTLRALRHRVNMATAPFAEEPADEEFVGHITIARLKRARRAELEFVAGFIHRFKKRVLGSWRADELLLMASELRREGSRYACLARLAFHGDAKME